ncbi:MAG: tRNA (adenosine(37)-N6)-dimethylallyltransferase MiaA [Bradymonadaceae bacterium]
MEISTEPSPDLPRLLVIGGPTGVGKSTFAVRVAEALDGEIVVADSVKVYRGVDIGTAKPGPEVRERVPHHMLDILDLDKPFDVGRYVRRATEVVAAIRDRGRRPIVTGGTGLYIRLLVHGIFEAPSIDAAIRRKWERLEREEGLSALYEWLGEVDPKLANRVDPEDGQRIRRGLEVWEQTGRPLTELQDEHQFEDPNYYPLKLGLLRPRDELHRRLNERFDRMLDEGLLDEYRSLLEQGYDRDLKPLQAIGYRQMGEHLLDGVPLEEAVRRAKAKTRQYAKRQISWFRSEPGLEWTRAPVADETGELPERVVEDLRGFFEGNEPDLSWADVDSYKL